MIIDAKVTHVKSGTVKYPLFIAFIEAQELLKVSKAPSFTEATSYEQIAKNVQSKPVLEWQRPINTKRSNAMARIFDDVSGEFMPNPVLLSSNEELSSDWIKIHDVDKDNVRIEIKESDGVAPLWIIDGQHRISGLGRSPQKHNHVPVVLLLNHKGKVYNGNILAKIFAQVTTKAEKLDKIHNEWLTYAFDLNKYESNYNGDQSAFEAVLCLCENSTLGGIANPFYDNIDFNKFRKGRSASPVPGGFSYGCDELQKIIKNYFYSIGGALNPKNVAEQIVLAHNALQNVIKTPPSLKDSVFFGNKNSGGQAICQDAFIVGVLSYLRNHKPMASSTNWLNYLKKIGFDHPNIDWEFNWVVSLSGPLNDISSNIINNVFIQIFKTGNPISNDPINDYLRGNDTLLDFGLYELDKSWQIDHSKKKILKIKNKVSKISVPSKNIGFKVSNQSLNVGKVRFHIKTINGTGVFGAIATKLNNAVDKSIDNTGFVFNIGAFGLPAVNKLEADIEIVYYGGEVDQKSIEIKWT